MARRPRARQQTTEAQLQEAIAERDASLAVLLEDIGRLELALEEEGWRRLAVNGHQEFSRDGLRKLTNLARLMYLKNPLIQRWVKVQAFYVWGQGISIQARDPDVQAVVEAFLDDRQNRLELFDHQARTAKEIDLKVEGNLFFALFVHPTSGHTKLASIPFDEIDDVICNPDNRRDPWYYKRVWRQVTLDPDGGQREEQRTAYYPDYRYRPATQPPTIGTHPVLWNVPVMHVKTGGLSNMRFGLSELYCGLDWARAVKEDLEDYASLRRAHTRFAWSLTVPGGKSQVAAAKAKLGTTAGTSTSETNPAPTTGSTFVGGTGYQMQPIRTAGAQPHPEDARRLWLMVAAAAGYPETFFGDASVGSLATARSLDRPTELMMSDRQLLWADVLRDLSDFVVDRALSAPSGPLKRRARPAPAGADRVTTDRPADELDRTIDISFPEILEHDPIERVRALVEAAGLDGKVPERTLFLRTVVRLLLIELDVDDVDSLIEELFPDGVEAPTPAPVMPPGAPPADDDEDNAANRDQAASEALVAALGELRGTLARLLEGGDDAR